MREVGLGAQVLQRKSIMSHKHVFTRLRFAQRYENLTIDDWKRVIFSDETKINKFNSYGRSCCWIGPQHVHPIVKHGGGLVMIWECMTTFGPGAWYRIKGRIDRHLYKFILENFLWSTIQKCNMD